MLGAVGVGATAGALTGMATQLATPGGAAKLGAELAGALAAEKAIGKVTDNSYAKLGAAVVGGAAGNVLAKGFNAAIAGGWLANGLKKEIATIGWAMPETNIHYEGAKAIQARFNKLAE